MAIKIEMLRAFCAVAQAGNLSDAADQLGRTASAVSMVLKQLEAHLGAPLFENERKNRLTALGEQVLALGQVQLRQFDSTVQAIELAADAPQGMLRIAAVPSIAAARFPEVARVVSAEHPGVKIELRDSDTAQVIEALAQGWADIGVASARHVLKGVTVSLLLRDPFGLVLSSTHPLAQVEGLLRIEDVFAVPFLRNALCDQIETPTFRAQLSNADITVHNTQSLLAMVQGGDWVTVLPQSVTGLGAEGLVFRPIADLPDLREVFLYQRDDAPSTGIVGRAADVIRARVQSSLM